MNNILNKYEALRAALSQANLDAETTRMISCKLSGSCYELQLRSDWVSYECYVGAVSGELLGLNYEPSIDVEGTDGTVCAELLGKKKLAA